MTVFGDFKGVGNNEKIFNCSSYEVIDDFRIEELLLS